MTSVVSGLKEMRNSLRIALRSSPRKKRQGRRRGGSWRANATGRTNRSPRSRSPPRRRQDDDDAFDGLEALGEAAVISQLTDSLSSEQFVLDPPDASSVEPEPVLAVTPPTLEPAPIKVAYSPDGYGEPGATTIIQRSYDDVVHTPRRLSIDGDDPLEGDDGVWGQYLELDETESAQRVPALIVVPYLSPPIDIAPTSPTTRRSSNF